MSISLEKLRYFVTVARLEHVGRAAKSVGISPSVISATINSLEEEYGCELFERKQNRIFLNTNGARLLEEAEKIIESINSLSEKLTNRTEELTGKYRIGASHFLAMKYLSPAWTKLQKTHPKLIGEICSIDTGSAIAEVLNGTLDLALVFSPFKHQDISETILHQGQFYLCVKSKHPVLKESSSGTGQVKLLNNYPSISFRASKGPNICENHPAFSEHGLRPHHILFYDNDFMTLDHLMHFNSWALLPDIVIEHFGDKLKIVKPKLWEAPMTVSLIIRTHRLGDVALKELRENLTELFNS